MKNNFATIFQSWLALDFRLNLPPEAAEASTVAVAAERNLLADCMERGDVCNERQVSARMTVKYCSDSPDGQGGPP